MEQLEPTYYYHVFNHANGNEQLFRTKENYLYFLKKYKQYIDPLTDTFAYCLMPNHFHFLIRIKEETNIKENLSGFKIPDRFNINHFISKQFSNFFNCYSKSYNTQFNRTGSLFKRPFQRIRISNQKYLIQALIYIHLNPVHHNFVSNPEMWTFSSYNTYIKNKLTNIKKDEVLLWFDDLNNFIESHNLKISEIYASNLVMNY